MAVSNTKFESGRKLQGLQGSCQCLPIFQRCILNSEDSFCTFRSSEFAVPSPWVLHPSKSLMCSVWASYHQLHQCNFRHCHWLGKSNNVNLFSFVIITEPKSFVSRRVNLKTSIIIINDIIKLNNKEKRRKDDKNYQST